MMIWFLSECFSAVEFYQYFAENDLTVNINILQHRSLSNGSSHSLWIWEKRMLNWAGSVSSTFWFTCQFFLISALHIVLYLRDHTRRNCTKIKVRRNCIWHTYVITALVCSVCRITSLTLCKIPCCFLCFKIGAFLRQRWAFSMCNAIEIYLHWSAGTRHKNLPNVT